RWVPIIFTSALTGQRVHRALDLVLEVAAERSRRISTHEVNEFVRELVERRAPPQFRGQHVKIFYATQAETAPPTFVLFTNFPKGIAEHYTRYLHNAFRERWGFIGSPLRIRYKGRREDEV